MAVPNVYMPMYTNGHTGTRILLPAGVAVATAYGNITVHTNGHICAIIFTNMERRIYFNQENLR